MPIFEFRCRKCGKEFEELILSSDPDPCCPQCQGNEVDKLLSAFSFSSKGGSSDAVSTSASRSGGCSSCSSKSCSTCR
ncbi:MAG: zinc ribbon domain-containing protein [Proteobacteria bacterium]|nr:zinc ribbon domain-containing protein [Pseudomonadota bacterium]